MASTAEARLVPTVRRMSLWLLTSAAVCGLSAGAHAQESPSAENPEAEETEGELAPPTIVVTAERRAMNLQDTPISIVAMTEAMTEAKGIENLEDLSKFTPNLSITPSRGVVQLPVLGLKPV